MPVFDIPFAATRMKGAILQMKAGTRTSSVNWNINHEGWCIMVEQLLACPPCLVKCQMWSDKDRHKSAGSYPSGL